MRKRRYVSIILDEQYVVRWELGFQALAIQLGPLMTAYGMEKWPELVQAEPEHFGRWRLIFACPEE